MSESWRASDSSSNGMRVSRAEPEDGTSLSPTASPGIGSRWCPTRGLHGPRSAWSRRSGASRRSRRVRDCRGRDEQVEHLPANRAPARRAATRTRDPARGTPSTAQNGRGANSRRSFTSVPNAYARFNENAIDKPHIAATPPTRWTSDTDSSAQGTPGWCETRRAWTMTECY